MFSIIKHCIHKKSHLSKDRISLPINLSKPFPYSFCDIHNNSLNKSFLNYPLNQFSHNSPLNKYGAITHCNNPTSLKKLSTFTSIFNKIVKSHYLSFLFSNSCNRCFT